MEKKEALVDWEFTQSFMQDEAWAAPCTVGRISVSRRSGGEKLEASAAAAPLSSQRSLHFLAGAA